MLTLHANTLYNKGILDLNCHDHITNLRQNYLMKSLCYLAVVVDEEVDLVVVEVEVLDVVDVVVSLTKSVLNFGGICVGLISDLEHWSSKLLSNNSSNFAPSIKLLTAAMFVVFCTHRVSILSNLTNIQ